MSGCSDTRILRPPEKTSTVPSSLVPEEGPVGRRRLGELLHLLAEVGHVLLGRLQGEGELLVLRDGLGQLALGLEQLLLEGLDPPRALLEAPAQDGDLLLGGLGPDPQRVEVVLGRVRPPVVVGTVVEINRWNHLARIAPLLATLHRRLSVQRAIPVTGRRRNSGPSDGPSVTRLPGCG